MKNRSSHKSIWVRLGALLSVIALISLWMPTPQSTAQQDNRQLSRNQSEQSSQPTQRRIALVIGNGAYTNAPLLKNPPNDARDMAATLKVLGFDVVSGINVNQRDMKRLIREFGQKIKAGGSGLFYYAGHGVQSKGRNYLIPVEADIQSEIEAEDAGVDVSLVLGYMDDAQNGLNIVILDACRNNPFARSFRSASSGLAQVDAPTGTLIAYATAPGRVASDGDGRNGLYTSALLKQMRVPGLSASEMFMQVRAEVMKQTGGKQVPWEASSLVGSFYFTAPSNAAGSSESATSQPRDDSAAFELSYWESIKNSTNPEDFRLYLNKYPNGSFAEVAKLRSDPTLSSNAPRLPSVDEVLGDYIKAIGGKESIALLNTIVMKGSYEISYRDQNAVGRVELYQKRPGKSLLIMKVKGTVSKEVYDGTNGWLYGTGSGTKIATASQLDVQRRSIAWDSGDIDRIKQVYSKITVKDKTKLEEREVFVVEATLPDGRTEKVYIDTQTSLPYRWDLALDSVSIQQGITLPTQLYLSDYISINGVKMPMTIRQVQSGGAATIRFDVLDLKFNIPLDEKLFRKP